MKQLKVKRYFKISYLPSGSIVADPTSHPYFVLVYIPFRKRKYGPDSLTLKRTLKVFFRQVDWFAGFMNLCPRGRGFESQCTQLFVLGRESVA